MNFRKGMVKMCWYLGLSVKELSDITGHTAVYHHMIESGERVPRIQSLEKMADKLNVPAPVILWLGMEESDIKMAHPDFQKFKPVIDKMIKRMYFPNFKPKK